MSDSKTGKSDHDKAADLLSIALIAALGIGFVFAMVWFAVGAGIASCMATATTPAAGIVCFSGGIQIFTIVVVSIATPAILAIGLYVVRVKWSD